MSPSGAFAFGPVAQLGERYNRTVEVRGSNPLRSTEPGILYLAFNIIMIRKRLRSGVVGTRVASERYFIG